MADSGPSQSSLAPVARPRSALTIEVYDNLLNALMDGRLAPGDRLVMDRLAEDLGVSRSPVRDALLRLHREGVVEPAGRRGYVVREASGSDIHSFYAARVAVEAFAAQQLTSLESPPWADLRELLAKLAANAPTSVRESFEVNRLFHRGVVSATGNNYLQDMFDAIWNRSRTGLTFRDFSNAFPYASFESDHSALLDALERADTDQARALMIDHIECGLESTRPNARQAEHKD